MHPAAWLWAQPTDLQRAVSPFARSPSSALLLTFFFWEGSPTKIDYRNKSGNLILPSLKSTLLQRKRVDGI